LAAQKTRRQEIVDRISADEWEFDTLRKELCISVKVLEEDLRHIERSVRTGGRRLVVRQATCDACEFVFKKTAFHPPGRCPSCRDRRITGPWFRIV
jgi:predicted Zn-ribbon and HTH transcriptional regulator